VPVLDTGSQNKSLLKGIMFSLSRSVRQGVDTLLFNLNWYFIFLDGSLTDVASVINVQANYFEREIILN
jgi:hypothetical protein